jgi:ATP-binding cassette subfamily F protein 3
VASRTADPAWGKRLKARVSQLDREKRNAVEKPEAEASKMRLNFVAAKSRADVALQVRGYTKAFGDRVLFEGAELEVRAGERVALIGPNGCGKTTLVRDVIAHGAWDDATLRIGPSMRVGYCAQEQEVLDSSRTVLEELLAVGGLTRERAWAVLSQLLFRHDDLTKAVRDLSGGERNRLQLAKLMVQQPDFLILDEPTNHLDIPACEAVEEALSEFKGTLLVISHDRYFLDKVADCVVEVRDRRFEPYYGTFSEYWFQRVATRRSPARVATRRAERERRPGKGRVREAATTAPPQGVTSALQQRIEEAERERKALETRIAQAFTRGDYREGGRISQQLERQRARLDDLYEQWAREG